MEPVVRNLATVPEQDVRAMVAYLVALAGVPTAEENAKRKSARATLAILKAAASAGRRCTPALAPLPRPGQGSVLGRRAAPRARHCDDGSDLEEPARITLEASSRRRASRAARCGFAEALTDAQVRELMAYIREHFGRAPPWSDVDEELREIREGRK
jgi:nicotinate dehydrogenase subunit B